MFAFNPKAVGIWNLRDLKACKLGTKSMLNVTLIMYHL